MKKTVLEKDGWRLCVSASGKRYELFEKVGPREALRRHRKRASEMAVNLPEGCVFASDEVNALPDSPALVDRAHAEKAARREAGWKLRPLGDAYPRVLAVGYRVRLAVSLSGDRYWVQYWVRADTWRLLAKASTRGELIAWLRTSAWKAETLRPIFDALEGLPEVASEGDWPDVAAAVSGEAERLFPKLPPTLRRKKPRGAVRRSRGA